LPGEHPKMAIAMQRAPSILPLLRCLVLSQGCNIGLAEPKLLQNCIGALTQYGGR
jgi:hypothetical protein